MGGREGPRARQALRRGRDLERKGRTLHGGIEPSIALANLGNYGPVGRPQVEYAWTIGDLIYITLLCQPHSGEEMTSSWFGTRMRWLLSKIPATE